MCEIKFHHRISTLQYKIRFTVNQPEVQSYNSESLYFKVPFQRKALGLRPKSHKILIEIKIEVRYLKKNSQTSQNKNRENLNRSNAYDF